MPVYDYQCRNCRYTWEVRLAPEETPPESCPSCGSKEVNRLFPAPYVAKTAGRTPGKTCCGREERCATPPCAAEGSCRKS